MYFWNAERSHVDLQCRKCETVTHTRATLQEGYSKNCETEMKFLELKDKLKTNKSSGRDGIQLRAYTRAGKMPRGNCYKTSAGHFCVILTDYDKTLLYLLSLGHTIVTQSPSDSSEHHRFLYAFECTLLLGSIDCRDKTSLK